MVSFLNKFVWFVIFQMNCVLPVFSGGEEEESCTLKQARTDSISDMCSGLESYKPWSEDPICGKYTVSRSIENTWRPTALVGIHASGLKWFAQAIERSSGIVTDDFMPKAILQSPRSQTICSIRPWDGKSILQIHTDVMYNMFPAWYKKLLAFDSDQEMSWPVLSKVFFKYRGIMIIRNPWETLMGVRRNIEQQTRMCCSKKRQLNDRDFEPNAFNGFLQTGIKNWLLQIETWVKASQRGTNLLIIRYEDMILNPEAEIKKALTFLNATIDSGRIACTLSDAPLYHDYVPNHEEKTRLAMFFKKRLNDKLESTLEEGITRINKLMKENGYTEVPYYEVPKAPHLNTIVRSYIR